MYGWTRTRLAALLFAGGLLSLLPACKQAEGERCQITDDCQTGLYCEYGGNTKTIGGYCKNATATSIYDLSMPPPDLTAAPIDMAASPDMATPPDLL